MFILYSDILLKGRNKKNLIESAVFLGVNLFFKDEWTKKGILPAGEGP